MTLRENTILKIEVLYEATIDSINRKVFDLSIKQGLDKLGQRPTNSTPLTKKLRQQAITKVINNSSDRTEFYPGGKK